MKTIKYIYFLFIGLILASWSDFLDTPPLAEPSASTFWKNYDQGVMWVNGLYRALPGVGDYQFEIMSDNCYGIENPGATRIGNGSFDPNTSTVGDKWDYVYIRDCLILLDEVNSISDLTSTEKNNLTGQARFILAFRYFEMITLYGDVPLVDKVLTAKESDIPVSKKGVVLAYLLEQLDMAIDELPLSWPASEAGRVTKGAALALKARVMLYNNRWEEAANAAKVVMDLGVYELHPRYNELFLEEFNNKTKEGILSRQYVDVVQTHSLYDRYGFPSMAVSATAQVLPSLLDAYEDTLGNRITDPGTVYDPLHPWEKRDPRFRMTILSPYESIGGITYDPVNNFIDNQYSHTYFYYRKYIEDYNPKQRWLYNNWHIFRYAEVLLTYAEAKNEQSGPSYDIYDAIDLVRERAGMPGIDRDKYNTKDLLRERIRNERRIEFAAEGLRYYDIIRWKIAEQVLDKTIYSFEIPELLEKQNIETRVFDPSKDYVWPIPQSAIDKAKNLKQHPEWL